MKNTGQKRRELGAAAELIAQAAMILAGYNIYNIVLDTGDVDFLAEKNGEVTKVQVKSVSNKRPFSLTKRIKQNGRTKSISYSLNSVDVFALVKINTGEVFLLPNDPNIKVISPGRLTNKIYPITENKDHVLFYGDNRHNARNFVKIKNKTSVFKGVGLYARDGRWQSFITIDGKYKRIGFFKCEKEAAIAYNEYIVSHDLADKFYLNKI
jgi:hypothetical protein